MACSSCNTGNCGCTDLTLPVGGDGAQGVQGEYGGFSTDLLFSTSTSTGPTSGQLRFDSGTSNLVANIYVSDTNGSSKDIDSFLDSFSNGGAYGIVRVFKESDSTKFWYGTVTAVTDNGTDHTITVTYIGASNATVSNLFSASDSVVITFSPRGNTGATGTAGSDGTDGTMGATGAAGVSPGLEYKFDVATTNADPGAGYLKFSNSNLTLATAIYIAATENNAVDVEDFLDAADNSTSSLKALIKVTKKSDEAKFALFTMASATKTGSGATAWYALTVTNVATSATSPFTDEDEVMIHFTLVGDKGDSGSSATQAVDLLHNNVTESASDGSGLETLMSYTLPAGSLVNNGDYVHITAVFETAATANAKTIGLEFGSFSIATTSTYNDIRFRIDIEVTRTSATTQLITYSYKQYDPSTMTGVSGLSDITTGSETLAGTISIDAICTSTVASDVICKQLKVLKYSI